MSIELGQAWVLLVDIVEPCPLSLNIQRTVVIEGIRISTLLQSMQFCNHPSLIFCWWRWKLLLLHCQQLPGPLAGPSSIICSNLCLIGRTRMPSQGSTPQSFSHCLLLSNCLCLTLWSRLCCSLLLTHGCLYQSKKLNVINRDFEVWKSRMQLNQSTN